MSTSDVNTKKFTLAEAERMIAVRDCAAEGHPPTVIERTFATTPALQAFCPCMSYIWTPARTSVPNFMVDDEEVR